MSLGAVLKRSGVELVTAKKTGEFDIAATRG